MPHHGRSLHEVTAAGTPVTLGYLSCQDLIDERPEDHQPEAHSVVCGTVAVVYESPLDTQDIVYRHNKTNVVQHLQIR